MTLDAVPITDTVHTIEAQATTATADTWGIAGQQHAVAALRRAIASDHLSHAYLFVGPRGVGRATLARRLAAALACEAGTEGANGDPCLECRTCRQIEAGEWPDVERIAIGGLCDERDHKDHAADGSTRIRICQVRRLERVASIAPRQSPRRVFIVDTADELQTEAAHALLKTLEEPPGQTLVVLLATDVHEVLPTVRSRCQELTLHPLGAVALAEALATREGMDPEDAHELATLAQGRYGLALRLRQDPSLRVLRESAVEEMRRLVSAGRNERFDAAQRLSARWSRERESVLATLDTWRDWWRDLLYASAGVRSEAGSSDEAARSAEAVATPREAVQALRALQTAREHLLDNTNPQLALEVMMLDLPGLAPLAPTRGDATVEAAQATPEAAAP